jgi:ABC-type branched-subunit amino acid transport system substrate-binding protein
VTAHRPKARWVITGFMGLVLAACGGNAATGSSSSGSGGGSKSPINLGMIGPLTGARASVGQGMTQGAQLALDVVNAHGGVLGHQVNLVSQDDAADPGDAVPAAEKEINSDNVVAIIGPTSLTASVVLPLAIKAKIPNLMWGGGAAFDQETSPYFFRMSPSDTEQAEAMAVYAHSKGWDRIALAFGNTTADQSLVPGIVASAKALGMTILNQVTISIGATSFDSEISTLYSQHPQAILAQFDIPSAGVLFSELKARGLLSTPWVASNLWFTSQFFSTVGASVATGPIYMLNTGTENGGYQPFLNLYTPKYNSQTPTNGSTYMYDAVNVWALGAQEAGTWSSPGIEQGILKVSHGSNKCTSYVDCLNLLKSGKSISYDGASSSVNFDKYHNVYGPFDVLQFTSSGGTTTLSTLTPAEIQKAIGK